jgi:hypothetical protein
MANAAQLARTTLLFQTDLGLAEENAILRALTLPIIVLVADAETMASFSGQVAIITSAMLMARSGHRVFIDRSTALQCMKLLQPSANS